MYDYLKLWVLVLSIYARSWYVGIFGILIGRFFIRTSILLSRFLSFTMLWFLQTWIYKVRIIEIFHFFNRGGRHILMNIYLCSRILFQLDFWIFAKFLVNALLEIILVILRLNLTMLLCIRCHRNLLSFGRKLGKKKE